jgi:acyl dehydratase
MLYFEDLEVGSETYFGSYDVTRDEVLDFAKRYDPQPFHLSDEEAAKTHFGRIAATSNGSSFKCGLRSRSATSSRFSLSAIAASMRRGCKWLKGEEPATRNW